MAYYSCNMLLLVSALASVANPGAARSEEQVASPGNVATGHPSPPQPAGHPSEWVSDLDYPPNALRIKVEGRVTFELDVAKDGKPIGCEVLGSSNNSDLDKKTCQLLMQRARFVAATDAAGKPVPGKYHGALKWQIPDEPPALPAQSQFTISYDVLPDGSNSNCHVTASGAILARLPVDPQSLCTTLGKFAPQRGANGRPMKKHVVVQDSVVISDAP